MAYHTDVCPPEAAAPAAPRQRLDRRALGLGDITASTIANMAPAFSVFFGLGAMIAEGGIPVPLTLLLGGLAIALLGNTLAQFSRSVPSTGSFVTFIGKAFGPVMAITTVLVVTIGYVIAIAPVIAISGDFVRSVLDRYLHVSPPWQLVAALLVCFVTFMVLSGVKVSTRTALALVVFEVGYLALASIVVLVHNRGALDLHPLDPGRYSDGVHGFGIAFALAVFIYVGWENSAALAEETEQPRRNVPRALFTSLALVMGLYLVGSYAILIGFHENLAALGRSDVLFIDVAKNAAGFLEPLGYVAGVTSVVGVLIAAANSQARLMFNGAREGLIPGAAALGRVSQRHKAPWVALLAYVAVAVLIVLVFGWDDEPGEFLAKAATLGTIPVILVYLTANAALPVYWWRYHRDTFKPLVHLVLPVLGIAALGYPLWTLVKPGQIAPFDAYPWISLAIVAVSLVYAFVVNARVPGLSSRIGSIVADE